MSFDIDPADERFELDQCIDEIKRLQARIEKLEAVREAVSKMRKESLAAGVWYTGIGCEFAESVDDALAACEPQATDGSDV